MPHTISPIAHIGPRTRESLLLPGMRPACLVTCRCLAVLCARCRVRLCTNLSLLVQPLLLLLSFAEECHTSRGFHVFITVMAGGRMMRKYRRIDSLYFFIFFYFFFVSQSAFLFWPSGPYNPPLTHPLYLPCSLRCHPSLAHAPWTVCFATAPSRRATSSTITTLPPPTSATSPSRSVSRAHCLFAALPCLS